MAHEDPIEIEDITAIDNHPILHDSIDDMLTPLQRAYIGPPTLVREVERWYTVSPPP